MVTLKEDKLIIEYPLKSTKNCDAQCQYKDLLLALNSLLLDIWEQKQELLTGSKPKDEAYMQQVYAATDYLFRLRRSLKISQ